MQLVYNWHITEQCNYSCYYCFANWNCEKEIWGNDDAVNGILREIADSAQVENLKILMQGDTKPRLNFAGGEPLILGNRLVEIACKAKEIFDIDCSIITNGSLLDKNLAIIPYLTIVGISIDSLNAMLNKKIGRISRSGITITFSYLEDIVGKIRQINPKIKIKFNTVVNKLNWNHSFLQQLQQLNPDKIKVFRQVPYNGQSGITNEQFAVFLEKNTIKSGLRFVENNLEMIHSYLMIDPLGRFFQNGSQIEYKYSDMIHHVGLKRALENIAFDVERYKGRYQQTNQGGTNDSGIENKTCIRKTATAMLG